MNNYNLIQVLWVEDDQKVTTSYPYEAENEGLQLVAYPCWDEAKVALENDYDKWSAIILDAKCKFHHNSKDNPVIFLREALKDISVIAEKKHRVIPWFVLSGGAETEITDSINEERLKWDEDWTKSKNKTYYSKIEDRKDLFQRIRAINYKSHRLQIQEKYRNVFEAITECNINTIGYNALEDLLIPIHFPNDIENEDYNDKYEKARKVLEYIFRSMSSNGILPEWGKKVNLRWSSCILGGQNATKSKDKDVYSFKSKKRILPGALAVIVKTMVDIIPPFCHSEDDNEDIVSKEDYMHYVDSSTYLLNSFTLQICDLILWYRNYLKEHNNKEENSKNWEKVC